MNVKRMCSVSLTAGLIAVCSWLTVPAAVPYTMQSFAVFCSLLLLGAKDTLAAIGVYLAMGCIGLPVFSGFGGGIGHLFGPTGGYLFGFLLDALFCSFFEPAAAKRKWLRIPVLLFGQFLCYAAGTLWFCAVCGLRGTEYTAAAVLGTCVFPYIVPDIAKLILAAAVCGRIEKRLHRSPGSGRSFPG